MPTDIRWDRDLQSDLLSTVRDSQTAMVEVVRSWADVGQQFTRNLALPVAGVDISSFVDGVFDFAEQTLAAQHQLALALVGVAARQADTAVEVVEASARESLRGVEDLVGATHDEQEPRGREDTEQPQAAEQAGKDDGEDRKARKPDGKPDRRPFEERSLEDLVDRARELDIEGRSTMSKDELIAALRDHRQSQARKASAPAPKQDNSKVDRRPFEERSLEELRDRANELDIEGRSTMSKDELIAALRDDRSK